MRMLMMSWAVALMAPGVSAQRVDTVLANGWRADGVAVTLPHTWNVAALR